MWRCGLDACTSFCANRACGVTCLRLQVHTWRSPLGVTWRWALALTFWKHTICAAQFCCYHMCCEAAIRLEVSCVCVPIHSVVPSWQFRWSYIMILGAFDGVSAFDQVCTSTANPKLQPYLRSAIGGSAFVADANWVLWSLCRCGLQAACAIQSVCLYRSVCMYVFCIMSLFPVLVSCACYVICDHNACGDMVVLDNSTVCLDWCLSGLTSATKLKKLPEGVDYIA